MAIRIVRLGTARRVGRGFGSGRCAIRLRGVKKDQLATRDFYDVWVPELAPSAALVKQAQTSAVLD